MNDQGEFFDDYDGLLRPKTGEAYARSSDPDTSHMAAGEVEGERASRMENTVYEAILSNRSGLILHDIMSLTGLPNQSVSPRLAPLVRKKLVVDSGRREKGPYGKLCIVWQAAIYYNEI